MKFIFLGNTESDIALLKYESRTIPNVELLRVFFHPEQAEIFLSETPVEIAVVDTALQGAFETAKRMRDLYPQLIFIFIANDGSYARDAYRLRAPVYLERPLNRTDIRDALITAERLVVRDSKNGALTRNVFIRTFGGFDVFVDGERVCFRHKKAKELFALLVDRRGMEMNNEQVITALWEDAVNNVYYQNKLHRIMKDLRDTLEEVGIGPILVSRYNERCVNPKLFSCDYYMLLDGDEGLRAIYSGNYLPEYSWAEDTVGLLYQLCGLGLNSYY